ncbi:ATP-binding protein [Kribbella capetownensis]|uniref:ATP-binding protein n=1 Tax=Kribbella capetownensis TaxID=1572659 RepID=A0A4R0JQF4_9ACTN|nr:ATP-binding protein [Kribbella capetownensis]TCC44235.1 ATP-binding protein [Kribbella capetownensis]
MIASEQVAGLPHEGARIQALLRLLLAGFLVAVLVTQPPSAHLLLCWLIVLSYVLWSVASTVVLRLGGPEVLRYTWLALAVDVFTLAGLTLVADKSADTTWTAYTLLNGLFVVPLMAATQLSPLVCALATAPTVLAYLVSGLLIRPIDEEPISYVVLRALLLAVVGLACVLLTALQRARVLTIARLLQERNHLLEEMVQIEQREQRDLAETLHDGALQYVLAARQDVEPALAGDAECLERVEFALAETTRLLRATMSQLHPAALESAGLLPVLKDVADATRSRGRFSIDVVTHGWDESTRTAVDELLLVTVRELLTNVVKHAAARKVIVELARTDAVARLQVIDDGRGLGGVDLDARLRNGHLGLASRRIRVEAAGGWMRLRDADPHGTVAEVEVPLA